MGVRAKYIYEFTFIFQVCRVGQNRIYTLYMTVCMVISLPKIPFIHRSTYKSLVFANPTTYVQCLQLCPSPYRIGLQYAMRRPAFHDAFLPPDRKILVCISSHNNASSID